MRRPARINHAYDGPMYEALAKDIASGLPVADAKECVFKAIVNDHCVTGATAAAICRRLTFHNVPHHDGRAWRWDDVDTMLEKFRWAGFDARQAEHRERAASRSATT